MYIKLYVAEIFDIYVSTENYRKSYLKLKSKSESSNSIYIYIYSVKNIQRLFKMFNAFNCYISNSLKSDM